MGEPAARMDGPHERGAGNIRAAFDWLEAQADVALALRLATAAKQHAVWHGPLSEGRERLVRALALAGDRFPELRARALWALGRSLGGAT